MKVPFADYSSLCLYINKLASWLFYKKITCCLLFNTIQQLFTVQTCYVWSTILTSRSAHSQSQKLQPFTHSGISDLQTSVYKVSEFWRRKNVDDVKLPAFAKLYSSDYLWPMKCFSWPSQEFILVLMLLSAIVSPISCYKTLGEKMTRQRLSFKLICDPGLLDHLAYVNNIQRFSIFLTAEEKAPREPLGRQLPETRWKSPYMSDVPGNSWSYTGEHYISL